jgi:hypothetical protein
MLIYCSFIRWSNNFAQSSLVWTSLSDNRFRVIDIYALLTPIR